MPQGDQDKINEICWYLEKHFPRSDVVCTNDGEMLTKDFKIISGSTQTLLKVSLHVISDQSIEIIDFIKKEDVVKRLKDNPGGEFQFNKDGLS